MRERTNLSCAKFMQRVDLQGFALFHVRYAGSMSGVVFRANFHELGRIRTAQYTMPEVEVPNIMRPNVLATEQSGAMASPERITDSVIHLDVLVHIPQPVTAST